MYEDIIRTLYNFFSELYIDIEVGYRPKTDCFIFNVYDTVIEIPKKDIIFNKSMSEIKDIIDNSLHIEDIEHPFKPTDEFDPEEIPFN